MGTLCLSSTPILRCESLTELQFEVLIIPPALGLIFATALLIAKWGSGRQHLLLVAEGWIYFCFALLDSLSHIISASQVSLSTFKVLDIVIGACSFLPLLFYVLFLFFFTRSELVPILPERFQKLSTYLLFLFIPILITLNELSSFLGVAHRIIPGSNGPVLAVGFEDTAAQNLWTFFSSLTLALVTVYQALHFILAFVRLVKAFVDQRRIETSGTDESRLFRGIGWIALGIKFGAIESVIGFAEPYFGVVLVRRILRFLGRACLIIGVIKGADTLEDFEMFGGEARRPRRKSTLRMLISNPRNSTFRRLSPTASAFHNATMTQNHARERVTIHYQHGQAPILQMRFSALDMPSPADLVESIKSSPQLWLPRSRLDPIPSVSVPTTPARSFSQATGSPPAASTRPMSEYSYRPPRIVGLDGQLPPEQVDESYLELGRNSMTTMQSPRTTDTHSVGRNIGTRFPVSPRYHSGWGRAASMDSFSAAERRRWAMNLRAESSTGDLPRASRIHWLTNGQTSREALRHFTASEVRTVQKLEDPAEEQPNTAASLFTTSHSTRLSRLFSPTTANTEDALQGTRSPSSLRSGEWMAPPRRRPEKLRQPVDGIEAYRQGHIHNAPSESRSELDHRDALRQEMSSSVVNSLEAPNLPWLHTGDFSDEEEAHVERAYRMRRGITRVRSVEMVAGKNTPTPTHVGFAHESIAVEPHEIPPEDALQEIRGDSGSDRTARARADSNVLGEEDIDYVERTLDES